LLLAACVNLSRAQVQYWKDDFALFEHARQVTKDNYMAYTAVGGVWWKQGDFDRAMTNFYTALRIQPTYADVHLSIGSALLFTNKFPEAAREFEEAVRLKPAFPEARLNLGVAYEFMGNASAAISSFQEALRIDPDLAKAHLGLGDVLLGQSRYSEAIDHFRKVIALEPNSAEAMGRLAWLLATHADNQVRNGREAVELAVKACQLTQFKKVRLLNALGAAQAESGKFELASATAQKALDVARSTGQTTLVPMTESLLKLYQSGKPYHEEVRSVE
jgi:tetratricopeptide (TPR) repeat protein